MQTATARRRNTFMMLVDIVEFLCSQDDAGAKKRNLGTCNKDDRGCNNCS